MSGEVGWRGEEWDLFEAAALPRHRLRAARGHQNGPSGLTRIQSTWGLPAIDSSVGGSCLRRPGFYGRNVITPAGKSIPDGRGGTSVVGRQSGSTEAQRAR